MSKTFKTKEPSLNEYIALCRWILWLDAQNPTRRHKNMRTRGPTTLAIATAKRTNPERFAEWVNWAKSFLADHPTP
jgi:hypothetical protein